MLLRVISAGAGLLFSREAKPVCDEDFCDNCGDCLVCHVEDPCQRDENGQHSWVKYVE